MPKQKEFLQRAMKQKGLALYILEVYIREYAITYGTQDLEEFLSNILKKLKYVEEMKEDKLIKRKEKN